MKYAFVIIRAYPFAGGFSMEEVHLDFFAAVAAADLMNAQIPSEDQPVHDSYGLVEGYEFIVIKVELK